MKLLQGACRILWGEAPGSQGIGARSCSHEPAPFDCAKPVLSGPYSVSPAATLKPWNQEQREKRSLCRMLWRHVMAGGSGRWLVTASLLGVLASPSASLAQAERAWVDPPPETGSQTPTPAPSAAPPSSPPPPQAAAPDPAPAVPQQASTSPSVGAGEEKKDVAPPSPAAARKPDSETPAKQKAAAERKVRSSPPRQASSPVRSRKEEQSARRREPATEASRAEPRSRIERRARITRYGTIQEEGGSDLQLMRLRTIQLPDGRRIDILTRPDQDIASELPDGY